MLQAESRNWRTPENLMRGTVESYAQVEGKDHMIKLLIDMFGVKEVVKCLVQFEVK